MMEKYYLNSEITSASIWSRPKEGSPDIVGHWGIVVKNSAGEYLCHNMPKTGTVATPSSNMSNNWKKVVDLPIKSGKSIHV